MENLPQRLAYLREKPFPPLMVRVALELLGTIEAPGKANDNPIILGWADEIAHVCKRPYDNWAADFYNNDEIPWCGLFVGIVAIRSAQGRIERYPPKKYLAALAWAEWGTTVSNDDVQVGDVVCLVREGGGHVCIAVGVSEDGKIITAIGGNQKNAVNIMEFDLDRVYAVRRPPYSKKPDGARRYVLASVGNTSTAEA